MVAVARSYLAAPRQRTAVAKRSRELAMSLGDTPEPPASTEPKRARNGETDPHW